MDIRERGGAVDSAATLLVEQQADRIVVKLNRPAQRNAISAEMITELHSICARLEAAPTMLLLTGEGEHFAAGADIRELRERRLVDALAGINRTLFDRIARLPLPTVAAVSGCALGGGAELAYACDVRVATSTARFGNPEPELGIVAAAGASYRLPRLVGESLAKQVLLGGRILDAETALCSGLVAEIAAPGRHIDSAHRVLDRMARSAPLALRLTKTIIDGSAQHSVASDIAQAVLFETTEKQVRMSAFIEKAT